jgi:hypothetical protein
MPYTPGYTDPRFTGAKPTGQNNTIQTTQTPSHLEDKATVLGKEIKGGHLVKYESLLTESTYSGIFDSRRQKGMLVFVELFDDDTPCDKFYYLKSNLGHALSDWEALEFTSAFTTYVVADLAARDALTGMNVGDMAVVEDCRTAQEITDGDPVYSCIFSWNGTEWRRIDFLSNIDAAEVAANTAARHTQNTDTQIVRDSNGQALTADYIAVELAKITPKDDNTTSTASTWSSTKIASELDSHEQSAKDYTYSQQDIDSKDTNTLSSANTYTDDQLANLDQYNAGNGIEITGASNPKDISVDLSDIAEQAALGGSWIQVKTDGTRLYLDPSQINIASGAFIKSFAGTNGQTVFTLNEAEGPLATVIGLFVGGSIQSPDNYSKSGNTLTLNTGLDGPTEVILVYSKVVSGTDNAATIAYVDTQIDNLQGGNDVDTIASLRTDIDNGVGAGGQSFEVITSGPYTGNGTATQFQLPTNADFIVQLEVDESKQTSGYSISDPNLLTFEVAPADGAIIKVTYIRYTTTTPAPLGNGVPVGGVGGQVLAKSSNNDYDVAWITASGSGDMLVGIYDPTGIGADAFNRANHTGEQPISSITNLQGTLNNKLEQSNVVNAIDSQIGNTGWRSKLTQEEVQDLVQTLLNHANHVNISVTYDDANNQIILTSSGSGMTQEEIQDIVGLLFNHINHVNCSVTYDDANDQIIITGQDTQLSEEQVQDFASTLLTHANHTSIAASYDDANNRVVLSIDAHNHTASEITDFDTEVSNNPSVAANTAKQTNATHTGDATGSDNLTVEGIRGKTVVSGATAPSDGDILVFRNAGDSWVLEAKPASGSNPAINDVSDITITSVADNEVLSYDSGSGVWINKTAVEAGLANASQGALAEETNKQAIKREYASEDIILRRYGKTTLTDLPNASTFTTSLPAVGEEFRDPVSDMRSIYMRSQMDIRSLNGERRWTTVGDKWLWVQTSFNKFQIFDGQTLEFYQELTSSLSTPNDKIAEARAHPTDPDLVILPDGNQLKTWNLDTGAVSVLTTFSQNLASFLGGGDGNDIYDSKLVISFANGEYAVYDIATDEIVTASGRQAVDGSTTEPSFSRANVDYLCLAPSADMIIALGDGTGLSVIDFDGVLIDDIYTSDGHLGIGYREVNGVLHNLLMFKVVDTHPVSELPDSNTGDLVCCEYWLNGGSLMTHFHHTLKWIGNNSASEGQFSFCPGNGLFYIGHQYYDGSGEETPMANYITEIDAITGVHRRIASTYLADNNVQRQIEVYVSRSGDWVTYRTPLGTTNANGALFGVWLDQRNEAIGFHIQKGPDYITDYTVTEGDVTAHQAALSITESQISDLKSYQLADPFTTLTLAASMTLDMDTVNKDKPYELIWPNADTTDPNLTLSNTSTNKGKVTNIHLQNNSGSIRTITFAGGAARLYKGDTDNLTTDALAIADGADVEISIKAVNGDKLLIIITEY